MSDTHQTPAAPQQRPAPERGLSDAAVSADKYQQMLQLADSFDQTGAEIRERARLASQILADDDVVASADLSPGTFAEAEEDLRAATTGKQGLLTRSIELDADALVVRATVLTYQWIDELQEAAFKTLGSIAGRAIGYLAPEVALGGAIVSAGLIETDSLDRDGVTAYLNELAETNPELMEHMTDGGGLVEGLQLRALLTVGAMGSEHGAAASSGGLRAIGVAPFAADAGSALRDAAAGFSQESVTQAEAEASTEGGAPTSIEALMTNLHQADRRVSVQHVGAARYIAYLPGDQGGRGGRLRVVGADNQDYVAHVIRTIEAAVQGQPDARVMLVGVAGGGAVAAEIAAAAPSHAFVVDQVVTAGAPSAQVPHIPQHTRVLSLEDRADPIALLGSLINAQVDNRVTVVFDGSAAQGEPAYVAGGRAADVAEHPGLRAEIKHLQSLGYLAAG